MDCIFAFGGPSKSGKTTLGRRLAKELGLPFASFGDYVRKEANRNGLSDPSSEQLQATGQLLARTDMCGFCKAVLEEAGFVVGQGLVVDGVRHLSALSTLKVLIPQQRVKLVYLESSVAERVKRSSLNPHQLQRLDSHSVESEAVVIRKVADLVLDTSGSVDDCFSRLRSWALEQ
jgi:adenylate kinase family enzyme